MHYEGRRYYGQVYLTVNKDSGNRQADQTQKLIHTYNEIIINTERFRYICLLLGLNLMNLLTPYEHEVIDSGSVFFLSLTTANN